jgi:hypothetical protein
MEFLWHHTHACSKRIKNIGTVMYIVYRSYRIINKLPLPIRLCLYIYFTNDVRSSVPRMSRLRGKSLHTTDDLEITEII